MAHCVNGVEHVIFCSQHIYIILIGAMARLVAQAGKKTNPTKERVQRRVANAADE